MQFSAATRSPGGLILFPTRRTTRYHLLQGATRRRQGPVMTIDRIGKYQVLNPLGTGAHSTILHVRRAADSREYALKIVPVEGPEDQKFVDQACHEFRVAQMLNHPNLIKIYCLEKARDWLFRVRKVHLLIEYVNG